MTLAERVAGLTAAQRAAVVQALDLRAAAGGPAPLVAYVTLNHGATAGPGALLTYLAERLPEHMVPMCVVLPELPRLPNGKVDRNGLAVSSMPDAALPADAGPPLTEVERTLSRIWSMVLGQAVDRRRNFFEMGGDSILSLQVVSRARQEGLHLAPRHLFQYPTLAELAAFVSAPPEPRAEAEESDATTVALSPIQAFFFEQQIPNVHHWNMAVGFELQRPLPREILQQVVNDIQAAHPALRLRYTRAATGWTARVIPMAPAVPVTVLDVGGDPPEQQTQRVAQMVGQLHQSLNITTGPVMQVLHITAGGGQPQRVLLIVHHLMVDGVSWRIILDDFEVLAGQRAIGGEPALPAPATSFAGWTGRLTGSAARALVDAARAYWGRLRASDIPELPCDRSGANEERLSRRLSTRLSPAMTRALLDQVPAAYRTRIDDVLVAALVRTLTEWMKVPAVWLDLEGHGRHDVFDDVDLSRTVGWFTSLYPVLLTAAPGAPPDALLKGIKEQLRAVPDHGIGYGVLRYLLRDPLCTALPAPQVYFNYLGQFDTVGLGTVVGRMQRIDLDACHCPMSIRSHCVEINALVLDGQLQVEWSYGSELHERATIAGLAASYHAALEMLIAHCRAPDAGGFTPSDFPDAGLDQAALDRFIDRLTGPGST